MAEAEIDEWQVRLAAGWTLLWAGAAALAGKPLAADAVDVRRALVVMRLSARRWQTLTAKERRLSAADLNSLRGAACEVDMLMTRVPAAHVWRAQRHVVGVIGAVPLGLNATADYLFGIEYASHLARPQEMIHASDEALA